MIRIGFGIVATVVLLTLTVRAQTTPPVTPATNASPVIAAISDPAAKAQAIAAAEQALATDGCTVEKFTVHSPSMGREIEAVVILPPEYKDHPDKKYPILYALHGAKASADCFSRMVPIRAALKDKPMIVACFDGDSASMYVDSQNPRKAGRDPKDETLVKSLFMTFFFDEYIPFLDKKYRINPKQRMLTGFSMGGSGAFRYMVVNPDMFASVSSMSGGFCNIVPLVKGGPWFESFWGPYAQNEALYRAMDIETRMKTDVAKGEKIPALYICCGTEDRLLPASQEMRDFLKAQGIPCEYVEGPGGHSAAFWLNSLHSVMDFHWRSIQAK
jgi:putative tributyrin esterase